MKRILFVDDEQRILDGLRRSFRLYRAEWDAHYASGGLEALRRLADQPNIDVIVTDMRMPGMDGTALLGRVRELYPETVRIILSGHFDKVAGLRSMPVAHRFLSKPCEPAELMEAVEQTFYIKQVLPDDAVRRVAGAVGVLPFMSNTVTEIQKALDHPGTSVEQIARIVERDAGVASKVLQLVNSAFFGRSHLVDTIPQAISYLGLENLKNIVLSAEIFTQFEVSANGDGISIEHILRHSRIAAKIAGRLPLPEPLRGQGVLAALLHDVGKLVLASRVPKLNARAAKMAEENEIPFQVIEAEVFGASHSEVGAYLLALWGIPRVIVEAVLHHHDPIESRQPGLTVCNAVFLAEALTEEVFDKAHKSHGNPTPNRSQSDSSNLATSDDHEMEIPLEEVVPQLGFPNELSAWRRFAADAASH